MFLPKQYLITPDPYDADHPVLFLEQLKRTLDSGIELVQLRSKKLNAIDYMRLAEQAMPLCQQHHALLLLNAHAPRRAHRHVDGLHLDSQSLMACEERPLPAGKLVAASCHTIAELQKAQSIGADFVTLSPVLPTASHPDTEPLGWNGFLALASQTLLPVYALGGLSTDALPRAEQHGAYGIAGIRCFWKP
ncbi:thiamine phosphate synthase [Mycetohabitans endofungorum]|jgi:thiamine-phosphate diphosphorylase|uniref:thiamine phosphate synthase n=1 Tax=Mycetohabitans endofungorum TaxID=417203 RepID=UPI002B0533EB|nr:thiamine phosphate synthase [Mycetohabitans endofungorum]